jgi:hypothetical protein
MSDVSSITFNVKFRRKWPLILLSLLRVKSPSWIWRFAIKHSVNLEQQ